MRMAVIAILAVIVVALVVVGWISPGEESIPAALNDQQALAGIGRQLDSLLVGYGINPSSVAVWRAGVAGKNFTRVVQRVFVPSEFVGFRFNHDLARALEPLHARVVGTERARESILTLHIVRNGVTVRSISFEPKPPKHS